MGFTKSHLGTHRQISNFARRQTHTYNSRTRVSSRPGPRQLSLLSIMVTVPLVMVWNGEKCGDCLVESRLLPTLGFCLGMQPKFNSVIMVFSIHVDAPLILLHTTCTTKRHVYRAIRRLNGFRSRQVAHSNTACATFIFDLFMDVLNRQTITD